MPCVGEEAPGELGVLGRDPDARAGRSLDAAAGESPATATTTRIGLRGGLRVLQLAEADDVAGGLLHPVPAGDAEVEQALGHVGRDLLRAQDAHLVDPGIVDVGLVVDRGGAHDREVGRLEQLERRLLERALRQHESQHGGRVYEDPGRPDGRSRRARQRPVSARSGSRPGAAGRGAGRRGRPRAARRSPWASPGCCRMMARPRMPAMPRDSRPSGLTRRIASARPGRLALDDRPRALRGEVARREAGAAGRHDQPGEARRPSPRSASATDVGAVGHDAVVDDVVARRPSSRSTRPRPLRSSRVPCTTPSDTVRTLAAQSVACVVAHDGRRYRSTIMPSVSASCGRTRRAAAVAAATARRAARRRLEPAGVVVVDRLGRGQRAHAVDEHAARAARAVRAAPQQVAAAARRAASTSAGSMRQRASARRRSAPRPEHGASTQHPVERSPGANGGRRAVGHDRGQRASSPSRAALSATSPARAGLQVGGDHEARPVAGQRGRLAARRGAQVERRGSPGCAPRPARPTHCDARSWM